MRTVTVVSSFKRTMPSFLTDAQVESTLAIFTHVDESTLSPDLQQQLQQLRCHLNTIYFDSDDLRRMGNRDDFLDTSPVITETHSPWEGNNCHPIDSQMYDGTKDVGIDQLEGEEDGIADGGEDGTDEGVGEEDPTDEYFPGRIRAERGRGQRGRGAGAGVGGGLGGVQVQNHNWRPDCNRGSGKFNLTSGKVARAQADASVEDDIEDDIDDEFSAGNPCPPVNESQALSEQARSILLKLSKSCQAILSESSKYYTDASQILEMLVGESPTWNANTAFADNSMEAIMSRCQHAERLVSCGKFTQFLALIHFRTKVER